MRALWLGLGLSFTTTLFADVIYMHEGGTQKRLALAKDDGTFVRYITDDKNWSIYLDQPATQLQNIVISAGQRGMQLRIPVAPLLTLLKAKIAEISTDNAEVSE